MNKKIALELYIHQHIPLLGWLAHWFGEKCKLIGFKFNHRTIILGTIYSVHVFFSKI